MSQSAATTLLPVAPSVTGEPRHPALLAPVIPLRRCRPTPGSATRQVPSPPSPGGRRLPDDEPTASVLAARRRAARHALPDPDRTMAGIAQAVLEVEAGVRSALQLERRCHPSAWERLDGALRRRHGAFVPGGAVRRVICQERAPGLALGTVVVERGGRVEGMHVTLDASQGRWMIAALDLLPAPWRRDGGC